MYIDLSEYAEINNSLRTKNKDLEKCNIDLNKKINSFGDKVEVEVNDKCENVYFSFKDEQKSKCCLCRKCNIL